jgi:exosortase/archaeosortase family protein
MFWVWRIDLVTLPVFLAGVVAILFGVRALWHYRVAILFLFLAWPWPYTTVLDRWLNAFTQVTIAAVNVALKIVPTATRMVGGDGSTFIVTHHNQSIPISVATECSGANGLVGFLLVGAAFLLVVRGTRVRKALWLGLGAVLVWLLNVLRIVTIFGTAHLWGESVAIDGFHPYIGLVVFNIGVLIMVLSMGRFDLEFSFPRSGDGDDRTPKPPRPGSGYRPSWRVALACVAVPAVLLAMLNSDLRNSDTVATSLGTPRLAEFAKSEEHPDGWAVQQVTEFPQYKRFFGASSTWVRYQYLDHGASGLSADVPVIADVIETSDRSSLDAYGIEACYRFHGFKISKQQSVDLGAGVVGGLLSWTNTDDGTSWTTLYWHWPIKTAAGTRYERVTLLLQNLNKSTYTSPPLDSSVTKSLELSVSDALAGSTRNSVNDQLLQARAFLVSFGRILVARRAPASATA